MPDHPEYVCRFCGVSDQVCELVELSGWQSIKDVRPDLNDEEGERLNHKPGSQREASWDSVDGDGFYCSACDNRTRLLHEILTVNPVFECRSCGWVGSKVENHECPETPTRIDVERPLRGQESLL